MLNQMRVDGRARGCFVSMPLLVFVLAPFLISACFFLNLVLMSGVLELLVFLGLNSWMLPVWVIWSLAGLPLSFLVSVRIGQFLLGRGVVERKG